ncbi:MAG: Heme/hemopexin transporter protein HuxB [Candidatus Omnitrophica bacterium]|nr:Heme/hemopexin transporter protein HuxB [Candidatus Omnitrophota bacterium]
MSSPVARSLQVMVSCMVSLAFSAGSGPAWAAAGPGPESQALERTWRQEPLSADAGTQEPEVREPEEAVPAASVEELPFTVTRIAVTGSEALPQAEWRRVVGPYEGRELTLSQARSIASQLTGLYRAAGYVTSRAYLPPQDLSAGTLEIRILEGRIETLQTRGLRYTRADRIERDFEPLRGRPLKLDTLKSALRNANSRPDRTVRTVIVPGQDLGASDLVLDVDDRRPYHLGAEINNHGTEATGRERAHVWLRHTNLLGWDDRLAVRAQGGEHVFGLSAQAVYPLADDLTEIGWQAGYTDVSIGGLLTPLDLGGEAYLAGLTLDRRVYDGKHVRLTWANRLDYKKIENTLLGIETSQDDLRMVRTGARIEQQDRWGRTFAYIEGTLGTAEFGGSEKNDPRLSRRAAGAPWVKLTALLQRLQALWAGGLGVARLQAQVTPDSLVSAEQLEAGGVGSVRGYPQSDTLSDAGVTGGVELRQELGFLPVEARVPWTRTSWRQALRATVFVDAAHAVVRAPAAGEDRSRSLCGAGIGLRLDLPDGLEARVEWAWPLGDEPADRSTGTLYFSVAREFF